MDTKIIDGKEIAAAIKGELKQEIAEKGLTPGLAVVLVGENSASKVYVANKKKDCEEVGIKSFSYELPEETSEQDVLDLIDVLNADPNVHGILVQLPVPKHMDEHKIIRAISPKKDVDGFHPENVGALSVGLPGFVSCTPAGVMELLKRYEISLQGKKAVVIGRSNIVGKPAGLLLLQENATVTLCHSRTNNLTEEIKQADIVVAAVGIPKMIKGNMLKPGAVVIDVGMNRDENGKLCGDVDFDDAFGIASYITPVPGGVGLMTRAMLLKNCVLAASK
ncbi:MAG: bifunctional methylenetetrahydrofolate dehydrogenase/methenyltetrahydrofolate cyclohydrolase FolD [Cellulosilyticaceae bacterium]